MRVDSDIPQDETSCFDPVERDDMMSDDMSDHSHDWSDDDIEDGDSLPEMYDEEGGGHLSCKCGKVVIALPHKSILRYECCCCDCRKAVSFFAAAKGVGPPPQPFADIVYFPNIFMVNQGREHLRCYAIQTGFPSCRVYASCCWTCMLADNPAYESKRLAVYANHATLELNGLVANGRHPLRAADDRIRQSDMTAAELAALPPFHPPGASRIRKWPDATAHAESAVREMKGADGVQWAPKWRLWHLETLQQLIASLASGVEVMDPTHQGPTPYWLRHGFAPHHRAAEVASPPPAQHAGGGGSEVKGEGRWASEGVRRVGARPPNGDLWIYEWLWVLVVFVGAAVARYW